MPGYISAGSRRAELISRASNSWLRDGDVCRPGGDLGLAVSTGRERVVDVKDPGRPSLPLARSDAAIDAIGTPTIPKPTIAAGEMSHYPEDEHLGDEDIERTRTEVATCEPGAGVPVPGTG